MTAPQTLLADDLLRFNGVPLIWLFFVALVLIAIVVSVRKKSR